MNGTQSWKMLPALGYNLLTTSAEGTNGPAQKKSITTTYVLWLFGGFFGLHHFYLGRDSQAFLWWASLGGYFGFGWLRDLFVIPRYVAEANQDPKYFEQLIQKIKSHPTVSIRYSFHSIKIFILVNSRLSRDGDSQV